MSRDLVRIIREQFALDWDGIHGAPHWGRVLENGLRLAEATGARRDVVELFAFLHDSKRRCHGDDPEHGPRAAAFARALCGSAFELEPSGLELLVAACRDHGKGFTVGDATLVTCWDADRLDLGRVGIRPTPERLCTRAACDLAMIEWAYRRSLEQQEE